MVKHILVPIDGSDHAWKALDVACTLARGADARMTVISVVTKAALSDAERRFAETEFPDEVSQALGGGAFTDISGQRVLERLGEAAGTLRNAIAGGLLDRARAEAHEKGVTQLSATSVEGDPAEQILIFARENDVDAIVMGNRGLGALKGLLIGSVSQKVSSLSECSCMTVK